jgi:phosphoribosylformylglycinamidine (FGAM) synthase-like enzyme
VQFTGRLTAGVTALIVALTLYTASARCEVAESEGASWYAQTSVYTTHFSSDPDHNNHQNLINVERHTPGRWLAGGAFFNNSFGQPSVYGYLGRRWNFPMSEEQSFHFKLTGGLLYGYKEPYKDKIPLNGLGIAPAILPAIGYRYRRFGTEIIIFGDAGAMLTAGFHFP